MNRAPLPMRSPSPDPYPDMGTDSTQPQTQPQTLPQELEPDTPVVHPDCWGLLVPCSSGQPSGVIQLRKRPLPPGAEPVWPRPATEEHTFKIGRGSQNDFTLPGQKISEYLGFPFALCSCCTRSCQFSSYFSLPRRRCMVARSG